MSSTTTPAPAPPADQAVAIEWVVRDEGAQALIHRAQFDVDSLAPGDEWLERLRAPFAVMPRLAAVGAKRVRGDRVRSMGEFVLHPKGFHSLGQGYPALAYRFPEEVDAIAEGVALVDRKRFDDAGGLDASLGALALLDLCLRLRERDGRCVVTPDVVAIEAEDRPGRIVVSDAESSRFQAKWEFDWRAPDLDEARRRFAGAGLLWNPRFWGAPMPFEKYTMRPALHWTSYRENSDYRARADHLAAIVKRLTPAGVALDLGCGDGLFTHLVAQTGIIAAGVDVEPDAIEQARRCVAQAGPYPSESPRFVQSDGGPLPFPDESFNTIFMFDVIEHLPNPIGVLKDASRVLRPGGHLLVTTPEAQYGRWNDPFYHVTEFSPRELKWLINAAPGLTVADMSRIGGVYRDLVVAAVRSG
ncbi:MAG: class I SAM-dependent methyltransferase [Phycisphaerales bacterium]